MAEKNINSAEYDRRYKFLANVYYLLSNERFQLKIKNKKEKGVKIYGLQNNSKIYVAKVFRNRDLIFEKEFTRKSDAIKAAESYFHRYRGSTYHVKEYTVDQYNRRNNIFVKFFNFLFEDDLDRGK